MALLDLSLVTRCFTTLLGGRIPTFPDWPAATPLLASAGAPDLVNAAHALSFYLYHVREDAHTKSQDWPVNDAVPQRFRPMGLTLYYVMTPRSNIVDANLRALADQLVMGLALKTMRDLPVIDDTSSVDTNGGPVLLMPATLRGRNNRLRALLQPTPANEAAQYWQAGTNPLRLAAYYEVAATLLEPEEPQTRRGRVLMVGVHSMVRGQPRIESTSNTITFMPPGELDPRVIELSPAEVPFGQTLAVRGADLKGDITTLLLNHRDFAEPVEADAAWALTTNGSLLTVTVQPTAGAQALLPGIYGAIVRTTARHTLPDGSQRDFDAFSNQSGFVIAPAIVSVVAAGPMLTITVDNFEPHLLAQGELLLFAGPTRLVRVGAGPPGAGEFFTPAAPPAARTTLRFQFPAGVVSGSVLPLRLVVRGAESGPWWETVP
ncbi:MAG TPA: Pvc16 family protein [Albitalea sp.]